MLAGGSTQRNNRRRHANEDINAAPENMCGGKHPENMAHPSGRPRELTVVQTWNLVRLIGRRFERACRAGEVLTRTPGLPSTRSEPRKEATERGLSLVEVFHRGDLLLKNVHGSFLGASLLMAPTLGRGTERGSKGASTPSRQRTKSSDDTNSVAHCFINTRFVEKKRHLN